MAQEREKWEEERQEKVKELLDVTLVLDGLRREREEEAKALLERQGRAVEEETETLRRSHQREIDHLKDEHQQEVGIPFLHRMNVECQKIQHFTLILVLHHANPHERVDFRSEDQSAEGAAGKADQPGGRAEETDQLNQAGI